MPDLEILPTTLSRRGQHCEPTTDPLEPYIIFEPRIPDVSGNPPQTHAEALADLQELSNSVITDVKLQQGDFTSLGKHRDYSLGEVLDTRAHELVGEGELGSMQQNHVLGKLVTAAARMARRSGFNREQARVGGYVVHDSQSDDSLTLNLHADSIARQLTESDNQVRSVRFICTAAPGTIIHPRFQGTSYCTDDLANRIDNPSEFDERTAFRGTDTPTDGLALATNARQIIPGYMLGFDRTRHLWHQAPPTDTPRVLFIVDVIEIT